MGKDFFKSEIERMISTLRMKQDMGNGIHTFRRVEFGSKYQAQNTIVMGNGRYEEVAYSVASLFAGRSSERVDMDEDQEKDEESEREKREKNNDSFKNSIKSRKAFQMAINDRSVPPAIQRLSRIANIIILCLIAIAVVDYSIAYKLLKDTIINY